MKRILYFMSLICLTLLIGLLCPCTVMAASQYGKTYTTSGTPCEKPEDVFENPYCFYKGIGEYEGIEVWAEEKQTVKLPMDGVFARDVLFINKSENYVSMKDPSGAKVTVSTAFADSISTTTDSRGYYSVKVFGSYNEYYGTWHQAQITVSKKGFAEQSAIIRPKAKKSITKSFKLSKKSTALMYNKTKEVNIGIQSNYFDVSENKKTIASIPFHSGLSKEKIQKYANLAIFNLKGTATAKIRLYAETACVAITEDGQYIATQRVGRDDSHSITVIYDNTGKKVYEREGYPPVGMLFSGGTLMGAWSENGKYLAVKTNMELYVCKASTGEILWKNQCSNCFDCGSRVLAVSNDGKYIAAGFNTERGIGKIVFYKKK